MCGAVIKAPFAFFKEQRELVFWDTVEAAHMALGLIPEVFDAIDMVCLAFDEAFGMIDPVMMKFRNIKHIVTVIAIKVDFV